MTYRAKIGLVGLLLTCFFSYAQAAERMYRCEFGIEGGCGYYIGDATEHMFQNVREMYGANFRYRFDQRWSLQAQGVMHHIAGPNPSGTKYADKKWDNHLVNIDAAAEFNFFRFGPQSYDRRVKPITPYIMWGLGMCLYNDFKQICAYMPFGIGLKWKFAPRMNLQVLWQNNLYFADDLENVGEWNDTYHLNGTNVLNCDITGTISLGLTFEFAMDKKVCQMCKH
ncbi:MAG: DUF6089 family protein [Paludibacteraceae bacterium]|nr:DUF6089 family protein [Paludibacteraceae bacterium]